MTGKTRITVVGAGLVGSLASLFLAKRGFEVVVYEQRPDMRRVAIPAGRSINLALANRGIDALDRLGLMAAVQRHLIPMRGRMIHDDAGAVQLQPYGRTPTEVIYSVSRGALNGLLMDAAEAAGVTIAFNHRCRRLDLEHKTLILVDEISGERRDAPYETLIGADGAGSAVRQAIAEATGGEVSEDILGHGYKELAIPPGPDGGFRLEKNALHIWPRGGYMLIALPNPDGSFTATLFLPTDGEESFTRLQTGKDVEAFFTRRFADAVPLFGDLTRSFFDNPTGMLGTIRCRPWHHRGDAVLIGDAAHAIVPFHGQGMNAGFEDCVALDACIDRHGEAWEAVFAAFEQERKPNADAIADMALENYVEMRDSVRDAKFLLKKALAWKLEELYPDAFIPRYSMVMFHLLPYAEAFRRGAIQAGILEELTETATTVEEVDLARAKRLIDERILQGAAGPAPPTPSNPHAASAPHRSERRMPADGKQPMNYERYILPHRLPDVRPRESADDPRRDSPDEPFFIRTHQAFEIWFAQILAELEYARLLLSQPAPGYVPESDIPVVEQHIRRATEIFDLIRQHLPLLETLKTTSFYDFRQHLFGASGTQSHRFREVEWLLGLLDDGLLDYTKRKRDLERSLVEAEATPKRRGGRGKPEPSKTSGPGQSERDYDLLAGYQAHWQSLREARRGRLRARPFAGMPATREALQRRLLDIETNGSLRAHALNWLARTAFPALRGTRPHARYGRHFADRFQQAYLAAHATDARALRALRGMDSGAMKRINDQAQQRASVFLDEPHRRAIVFLLQFSNQPLLAWPASLVEALLELDQAFANWRDRHIAMVVRVLGGGRISTLGAAGSGLPYLRDTTSKRAFPEILDARTFMLSHEEAKDIYSPQQLRPYGFLSEMRRPNDRG